MSSISLTIRNDFPTDLSNISFTLVNSINQNILGTFTYPLIPSNTLQTQTVSIAVSHPPNTIFPLAIEIKALIPGSYAYV